MKRTIADPGDGPRCPCADGRCGVVAVKAEDYTVNQQDTGGNRMHTVSRRALLRAAGLAATNAVAFPAIAQGRQAVRFAGINILSFCPLFVAKELGYYEAAGIDASIVETTGGQGTTSALLGGSVDVISTGYASPAVLAVQGRRVKSIVGLTMKSVYVFVVRPDAAVPTDNIPALVAWLRGKRLGVASLGSGADTVANGLLAEQGAGAGHVVKVATGTGAQAVAAMRAGAVDATVAYEPDLTQMIKSGVGKIVLDLRNTRAQTAYSNLPATTMQSTDEWIRRNPELAANVVRAIARANKTLQDDPETSVRALSKLFERADPADVRSMYEGERMSFRSPIPQDQYEAAHAMYLQQNIIARPVRYEDVVATQFAPLWT